jgi:hypothetical protein
MIGMTDNGRVFAFVADFERRTFHLKTKFDMKSKTSINQENGNDDNRLLADSANRKHAVEIIKKLTSRPEKNDDGYYDFYNDEKQMIEIVEEYLNRHYR